MKKRYSDVLGEWVKERESTKRDKNLVMFLAVKNDVADALEAGYPVKTIWEHMYSTKRLTMGYDSFLNYTNRQIRKPVNKPNTDKPSTKEKTVIKKVGNESTATTEVNKSDNKPKGFVINSSPKKEDLI